MALQASALTGSDFDAIDGNLVLNDDGAGGNEDVLDWENAPNLSVGGTQASETQSASDNAYKGGAKHDTPCPTAETGGIPPNKDDLTRLYVAHETGTNGDVFLYLGWERFLNKESSASAHMGFEFNQSTTPCGGTSQNVLRTRDDILITYDLEGGGKPTFLLLRWLPTLQSGDTCYAASAAPCWGNKLDLSAAGFAEGEVNRTAPILDPIRNPDENLNFKHMFGEGAVNLTDAGVFEGCQSFGRATLGSRSSGNSFVSTQKDFIGPIPVNIANCGRVVVEKVDESGAALDGAGFTLSPANNDGTTALSEVSTGLFCIDQLILGTQYTITESTVPDGYIGADPQTFTPTQSGSCSGVTSADADLTFENLPADGDVNIHKEDDDGNPLEGVIFNLSGTSDAGDTVDENCTTDASGDCSFSDVPFGTYTLDETNLDDEHGADADLPATVVVDESDEVINLSFVNPRKHKVIVLVCHEGTNTLAASDVTNGEGSLTTLGEGDAPEGLDEEDLCSLDGFEHKSHGEKDLTVDVGSDAHP